MSRKLSDAEKINRGTFQPCRASNVHEIQIEPKRLEMPKDLKGEARKVWHRILPVVYAAGKANDGTLDTIKCYCIIAGHMTDLNKKGEIITANAAQQLRQLSYDLGLNSPGSSDPKPPKKNKFNGVGKR